MKREITISLEITLNVSDDYLTFDKVDERLNRHIWEIDQEETGIEITCVNYIDASEVEL